MFQTAREYDQFVYRSAHDLKGPIARLKGICYLAKLDVDSGVQHDYVQIMENTSIEMEEKLSRLMRVHDVNERKVNRQEIFLRKFHLTLNE